MREFLNSGLQILLPQKCLLCGLRTKSKVLCKSCKLPDPVSSFMRCRRCFSQIGQSNADLCLSCSSLPETFSMQRFLWNYNAQAREVLRCIKYLPSRSLALLTCQHLSQYVAEILESSSYDLVLPVPCKLQSFRHREFNLPELFASVIKREIIGKELTNRECFCLRQKVKRRAQASLPAAQRLRNVLDCFECRHKMQGQRILLVDDVVTTGATAQAGFQALKIAGAGRIDLISIARSSAWEHYRRSLAQAY